MSLLPPYTPKVWRIIGICAGALFVLGLVLFTMDKCSSYFTNRDIEKRKANVNAILSNIQAIETGKIAATKEELAAEKAKAELETEDLLEAANATDAARAETNAALTNLNAARNANTTNSSVKDLEDALRRLE